MSERCVKCGQFLSGSYSYDSEGNARLVDVSCDCERGRSVDKEIVKKITHGWVVQTYEGSKCVSQEFRAGDIVEWEDDSGTPCIPLGSHFYQPFDMVQPDN